VSSGAARRPLSALVALALVGGAGAVALASPAAAVPTGGYLVYGLTATDALTTFRTGSPGTQTAPVALSGLAAGDDVVGLDVRPATGQLYGLVKGATTDRLVVVNPATGAVTQVGAALSPRLSGTAFGVDFNPTVDRLRVTSDADQNLRINPDTGAVVVDTPLAYATTDAGNGTNPSAVAGGYVNNVAGATSTTLFDVETTRDVLVTQNPPNAGTLNSVGALGVDATAASLDVAPTPAPGNDAFALLTVGGTAGLYTVSTATGAATLVGAAGAVTDIAIAVPRLTVSATGLTEGGTATVTVTRSGDTSTPATVAYSTADGTATAGADYTATSGSLSFAAGEGSKTVSLPLAQDLAVEGAETIAFTITTSTPDHVVSPGTTTLTVADDETGRAYALTAANEVVTLSVTAPGTATLTKAITGLNAGDDVVGIDVRPANGLLYAVVQGTTTASDRVYTVDPTTGAAALVGALSTGTPATPLRLSGASFGVDFNPVPDRLRVVSDADQNLRINPDNGVTIVDGALAYAAGDPNAAANPSVTGSGYTNNVAGATATTLYNVDTALNALVTQNPPNAGTLNTVGPLGVDPTAASDLDVAASGGAAFAALTVGSTPGLYRVNLATGAATSLGALPAGVEDLALASPGRFAVSAATATVAESAASATVSVARTGGANGTATVAYATADGTATAGSDYTATSGTLTFADGETTKTVQVPLLADTADEADETLTLTLSAPGGGASLSTPVAQTVTITDDDRKATAVTLSTSGPRAARGAPARVSGVLTGPSGPLAGRTVELVARQQYKTASAVVRTYTTAADGSFGGEVFPTVNTVLVARFAGDAGDDLAAASSPQVLQVVRTSLNAKADLNELTGPVATARLTGDTFPAKPGAVVRLVRVVNGKQFAFDAQATVGSNGRWALTRKLSRGTYVLRVVIGATFSNATGQSNEVTVRVS
jgi:hypothetical protein